MRVAFSICRFHNGKYIIKISWFSSSLNRISPLNNTCMNSFALIVKLIYKRKDKGKSCIFFIQKSCCINMTFRLQCANIASLAVKLCTSPLAHGCVSVCFCRWTKFCYLKFNVFLVSLFSIAHAKPMLPFLFSSFTSIECACVRVFLISLSSLCNDILYIGQTKCMNGAFFAVMGVVFHRCTLLLLTRIIKINKHARSFSSGIVRAWFLFFSLFEFYFFFLSQCLFI